MTKSERRISNFSSGMKKLDEKSLNYIHKLTQVLFMVEHLPIHPVLEDEAVELGNKNRPLKGDKCSGIALTDVKRNGRDCCEYY